MYRVIRAGHRPFITNDASVAEKVSALYDGARIQVENDEGKWVAYG